MAIYLATDSEEVKREMKERYGYRNTCSGKKAYRGSLEGIREGITDMYTLARTQKIYGSFQSSFSDMAAADRRGSIGDFEIMSCGNKSLF